MQAFIECKISVHKILKSKTLGFFFSLAGKVETFHVRGVGNLNINFTANQPSDWNLYRYFFTLFTLF